MKKTLKKLIVLNELIVTALFSYIALTLTFSSLLINFILLIIAMYVFLQALGNVDELNGYNTENTDNVKNPTTEFPDDIDDSSTGNPDNMN